MSEPTVSAVSNEKKRAFSLNLQLTKSVKFISTLEVGIRV